MKKNALWYCIFVLISIIGLMLWNIPRMNESFEIKNNDELGGTIITLQQDLTTLQKQFQTITSSLENTYKPIDLSGNVTTVQKLYHTILDFNPLIFSITDSDILQPVTPNQTKNATGDIVNTAIDKDSRWGMFLNILNALTASLTSLKDVIKKYQTDFPNPLPSGLTEEQQKNATQINGILNNIDYVMNVIEEDIKMIKAEKIP